MKKNCKRLIKGDKLHVKWKGYDDSFNTGLMKKVQYNTVRI